MFDTRSASQLATLFDHFHVPMFAAQRVRPGAPFVFVCANKAWCDVSGVCPADMRNADPSDLLPRDEAAAVQSRFADCVAAKEDQRYFECLTLPHGLRHWDILLQHAPVRSGIDRVIATAMPVLQDTGAANSRLVFEDIRFFSALADLQLQNLVSMFDAAQKSELFCANSSERVATLSGICRGVQRAVEDIRKTVRRAETPARHPPAEQAQSQNRATRHAAADTGGTTLRALAGSCDPDFNREDA